MACEEIQRVISDGDKRALRGRRVLSHLRSCPACAAFGASIDTRRADLLALSPALPAAAASALLARTVAGAGLAHGFAQGGGGGGVVGGLAGKTVGVVASGKAFTAGVAVLATAAVGATRVVDQMGAHAGSARTARPPVDLGSGLGAAGKSSASGRARQGSVAAGSVASASRGAGGGVSPPGQRSTSVGGRRGGEQAVRNAGGRSAGRGASRHGGAQVAPNLTPVRAYLL